MFEQFEVKGIENKQEKEILEELALSCNCRVHSEQWQSKYNSYISYDYEPFCSEGFTISLTFLGEQNNIKLLEYLMNKRYKDVQHLENCVQRSEEYIYANR